MRPDYVPDYRHCLLPYVQWFQDDFLGGIRGMKAQEIGIYTVLLNEMYNRGVALDQSEERLARMCGADIRVFKRVISDLIDDGKLIQLDCGLWNMRCENAFRSRAEMLKKQSDAGKTSAKKRRKNSDEVQRTMDSRSTVVEPISEAQILIVKEKDSSSSRPSAATVNETGLLKKAIEAEFSETFWPAYPRKVEKQDALKAFLKARRRASLEIIMAGLRLFAAEMSGKEAQFIRHASKWLNSASWENGADVASAAPPVVDAAVWTKRLNYARSKQTWDALKWGPFPHTPGCMVPANLLQPEDGAGWREWEQAA